MMNRIICLTVLLWLAALPAYADDLVTIQQLIKAGNTAEALTLTEQYLAGHPNHAQARFLKGVLLTQQNKTELAIQTFTALTEDYPELAEPYNNLAVLYASQGQYEKAKTALERAIQANPLYTIAYENLGDVYANLANQAYSKAVELDKNNAATKTKQATLNNLLNPKKP